MLFVMPGERSGKRITLADVAREAGVSVQTASHVLAGNMTVRLPERTRAKVRAAAEKVGYQPNRLAQAMKRGRTQVIGVWMPIDRPVLAYLRFLMQIHSCLRGTGYELMIIGFEGASAYGTETHTPAIWPVDGILAVDAGKAVGRYREDPRNSDTPVCIFGLEQFENTDSIAWDVAGAAKLVTQRMIEQGRKRIVHVTLEWVLADYPREQRRRGYTEAMTEAGLEPVYVSAVEETSSAAEKALEAYLTDNPTPDGMFCFTDTVAVGAARVLLDRGLSLGTDCSVWGFGDYPEGEGFRVPISTLRIPTESVVRRGVEWLMERINQGKLDPRLELVPMELVERGSTRII
jgi:DNA-binding LacI/PurR family transcriptional regulator